jgi:hypothetical protein
MRSPKGDKLYEIRNLLFILDRQRKWGGGVWFVLQYLQKYWSKEKLFRLRCSSRVGVVSIKTPMFISSEKTSKQIGSKGG